MTDTNNIYRANFGDGTWTRSFADIRDAKREIWARAGIVQYRSWIEVKSIGQDSWSVAIPSRASVNGPAIVERRN